MLFCNPFRFRKIMIFKTIKCEISVERIILCRIKRLDNCRLYYYCVHVGRRQLFFPRSLFPRPKHVIKNYKIAFATNTYNAYLIYNINAQKPRHDLNWLLYTINVLYGYICEIISMAIARSKRICAPAIIVVVKVWKNIRNINFIHFRDCIFTCCVQVVLTLLRSHYIYLLLN